MSRFLKVVQRYSLTLPSLQIGIVTCTSISPISSGPPASEKSHVNSDLMMSMFRSLHAAHGSKSGPEHVLRP